MGNRMVHLDSQGWIDEEVKELKVVCGRDYSKVRRAEIDIFLRYPNTRKCKECLKVYKKNKFLLLRAFINRKNVKLKELKGDTT